MLSSAVQVRAYCLGLHLQFKACDDYSMVTEHGMFALMRLALRMLHESIDGWLISGILSTLQLLRYTKLVQGHFD